MSFQHKKSDLRKLVLLMNKQNKRFFPPFKPLLTAIDLVLTDGELGLLLKLGTDTYTFDEAAAVSAMGREEFGALFESLKQKGFMGIFVDGNDQERYSLHPLVVGWFEAQATWLIGRPEEKEFARRYTGFFNGLRKLNFFPVRNLMNLMGKHAPISNQSVGILHESKNEKGKSTIVIDEEIAVPDSRIYPTNSINDLILEYGKKSLIGQFKECMCRRLYTALDAPCRFKMPSQGACMGFGDRIKPYIKYGYMRRISKEEAFDNLQIARDHGAVHTVFHEDDDTSLPQIGLCNCCWDCCGILRSYNMGATPLRYNAFYMAGIINSAKCTGCGKCVKYCPTAAVALLDKKVSLDPSRCIGCGQCVHQCSRAVFELFENRRTAFLPMLSKSEARITL